MNIRAIVIGAALIVAALGFVYWAYSPATPTPPVPAHQGGEPYKDLAIPPSK